MGTDAAGTASVGAAAEAALGPWSPTGRVPSPAGRGTSGPTWKVVPKDRVWRDPSWGQSSAGGCVAGRTRQRRQGSGGRLRWRSRRGPDAGTLSGACPVLSPGVCLQRTARGPTGQPRHGQRRGRLRGCPHVRRHVDGRVLTAASDEMSPQSSVRRWPARSSEWSDSWHICAVLQTRRGVYSHFCLLGPTDVLICVRQLW